MLSGGLHDNEPLLLAGLVRSHEPVGLGLVERAAAQRQGCWELWWIGWLRSGKAAGALLVGSRKVVGVQSPVQQFHESLSLPMTFSTTQSIT